VSELEKKCTAARELEADIKGLVDAINADGATPARLQRLFGFENSLSLAEAELSVPGAVVDIALEAGAEGRVTAHGKSVAAPSRIAVSESLDLAIDGIGSIRVTAAGAERAGAARRRREEAVAGLAQCLSEMEGASTDEAKSRAEARRAKVETLDRARARLSGLAPQGYAALDAERGNLEKHMPALDNAGLERDAQDREIAVLAARRSLEAVAASALDDAGFRRLSADLEAARREALRREEEARRASEQLERLKGEQAGIDEDGRAGEVDKANGALTYAGDEVKRLEDEIAALKLLVSALARAIDAVRNRYFEPVTRALAPYMAEIFPEAALGFRDGFSLSALTRAGEREDFATLSDGTREQLAVLVRMGFARLFALRGATVPLVLDDPLVYSDDARLAAMCRALEHAGREYQVLLMTCREAAFQGLDAHRLTLKDWRAHPV
jgi:DNA repair exonuclease SbcCD ATPase subunit